MFIPPWIEIQIYTFNLDPGWRRVHRLSRLDSSRLGGTQLSRWARTSRKNRRLRSMSTSERVGLFPGGVIGRSSGSMGGARSAPRSPLFLRERRLGRRRPHLGNLHLRPDAFLWTFRLRSLGRRPQRSPSHQTRSLPRAPLVPYCHLLRQRRTATTHFCAVNSLTQLNVLILL